MGKRKKEGSIPGIIFDTDILIWYFRGDEKARDFISAVSFENRYTSSVVLMELLQGCSNKIEVKKIKKMVEKNFFEVLHPNEEISELAINLLEKYSLSHGLASLDAVIAATSLFHNYRLATGNAKHYRFLKNLKLKSFVKK